MILVDTAGIRKRGRVAGGSDTDRYSTLRSFRAIDRADVAVLLVDAVEGLTAQDEHIAGYVVEQGRGLVVAVNKWDLVASKTDRTFDQYVTWIRKGAPFLDFAPVVSLSARTGQRVERILELAVEVWGERRRRIGTGELNRLLADATVRQPPPAVKGRRPKLFYATPGGDRAADVRVLRPRRRLGPFQLPALPREPASGRPRVHRDPDPADLPRALVGHAPADTFRFRVRVGFRVGLGSWTTVVRWAVACARSLVGRSVAPLTGRLQGSGCVRAVVS